MTAITIPDDLQDRLQRQAAEQQLAPDQFALSLTDCLIIAILQ